MPTPRQYILRGPCQVQYGGSTFYTKDNVVVTVNTKTFNVISDAIGKVDERVDDYDCQISFTPDGQATNAIFAVLYPYLQSGFYRGQSIFGDTDQPLTIWTRDGWKHVFACAAITKQPQFLASAVKTAFGSVTFRAIRANNTPWATANSLVQVTQAAYPGDAAYNLGNIITSPFTGLWVPTGFAVPTATINADTDASPDVVTTTAAHGFIVGDRVTITGVVGDLALNGTFIVATVPTTTTLTLNTLAGAQVIGSGTYVSGGTITRANGFDTTFSTEAGFTIDTNVTLDETVGKTDTDGLLDITYQMQDVTCKCIPVGPTPQEAILAMGVQSAGAIRGGSLAARGRNLYLVGTGIYAKLTAASLKTQSPIRAGANVKRLGEVSFTATQTFTGSTPNPLAAFSTAVIA